MIKLKMVGKMPMIAILCQISHRVRKGQMQVQDVLKEITLADIRGRRQLSNRQTEDRIGKL